MKAHALLHKLRAAGVECSLTGKGATPSHLIQMVKEHKAALIESLERRHPLYELASKVSRRTPLDSARFLLASTVFCISLCF